MWCVRMEACSFLTVLAMSCTEQSIVKHARPYTLSILSCATALFATSACGNKGGADAAAEAEKKALDAAAASLVQPIGLVSAYHAELAAPPSKEKYFPARHPDLDRAMAAAATEIRHAVNAARQALDRAGANGTKDLETAIKAVTVACTDATESEALAKCVTSVTALDGALQKVDAVRAAAGATTKFPRVAPESVTEEAKKSLANYLKAKGSSAADQAYIKKRSDPGATSADVIGACQAAVEVATNTQAEFERSEEHIRLIAVTHKMAVESQCGRLSTAETLQKDLGDCKKKAKTPECKVVCGKVKSMVDDGLPAAAFEPLSKEYQDICAK